MWLFIFKIVIFILLIVFAVVFPLVICHKFDLDGILISLTRTRYDENKQCDLGNQVYKILVCCCVSSFIFGVMLTFIFLSMVM